MITDRSRRRFVGPAAAAGAWPLLGRVAGAQSATLAVGSGGALKLGVASYSMIKKEFEYAKNAGFPRS
jgi:hypothetical protein